MFRAATGVRSTLNRSNIVRALSAGRRLAAQSRHQTSIALVAALQPDSEAVYRSEIRTRALILLALAALTGTVYLEQDKRKVAKACGIVGFVGTKEGPSKADARDVLLEGLTILRNRGYDSAGIATIDNDHTLIVSKFASRGSTADSIELLKENSSIHMGHTVGIAHTRWATHGGKTDKNAHPHLDWNHRIAVVHNGTINNANELRRALQAKGVTFASETDTEVIANLIGWELAENPDMTVKDATARALEYCDGTWGLAVIARHQPDHIVVACQGSPMVIGVGNGNVYVASETSAFSRFTRSFIAMTDGEIGVISGSDIGDIDLSRVQTARYEKILLDPAPYPHWTIRECLQQPETIARALAFGGRMADDRVVLGGPDRNVDRLKHVKHMVLAACGTSLYASEYGARLMRNLESLDSAVALDAGELCKFDLPRKNGAMLVVSQSGETRDVLKALKHAEGNGVPVLSVVNVVGSAIARETKLGIYLNAGREQAVASTKSFSSQVTVLSLLALWFRQLRDAERDEDDLPMPDKFPLIEALQRLPICFGMAQRVRPRCKKVAESLKNSTQCFVLGMGYGYPVAMEGSLKLKELAYLHAEGCSGASFKTNMKALIEGEGSKHGATPIIALILDDEHAQDMIAVAKEAKRLGARVHVITDNARFADGLDTSPMVVPSNGPLTALIAVLPLQLISYELAVLRGLNPDTPRNLAKAVTTD